MSMIPPNIQPLSGMKCDITNGGRGGQQLLDVPWSSQCPKVADPYVL